MTCKRCGSYAINHHAHGRDGSDPDLCDVCYWRKRAETADAAVAAALDCIVRRLQMDVDDGSRPDQWTMEDLIRTAKAALPAGWAIGAT